MSELIFLGICGSLRRESRNMGLLRAAKKNMPANSALEIADISQIPFYNQDIAKPKEVEHLIDQANKCDGYLFACPEYNYSLAPALKNALDWLSREPNLKPVSGKTGAIVGAGGGMGTARSQLALRQVCVYLNILLIDKPEFYSNAFSASFDSAGDLVDPKLLANLEGMLKTLCQWTETVKKGRE